MLPVSPSLALSVWLMEWMLSDSMDWLVDGRCAALCYDFADSLLRHFQLTHMQPSPLKEALLHLLARILSQIRNVDRPTASGHRVEVVKRVKGGPADKVLGAVKELKGEMVELFEKREAGAEIYSSFLQQELDVLIASDELRAPADRLVPSFRFPLPLTADEEKQQKDEEERKKALEAAEWSCTSCTFANPITATSCEMCATPKPKQVVVKVEGKGAGGDEGHRRPPPPVRPRRLHALPQRRRRPRRQRSRQGHHGDRVGGGAPRPGGGAHDSYRERAHRRRGGGEGGHHQRRAGGRTHVARAAVAPCTCTPTHPSSPSRPHCGGPTAGGARKEREVFEYSPGSSKRPFDEGGILYHLGSSGSDSTWQNPHETKVVVCSSSTIDGTSHVRSIISRFGTHFSTKSAQKSWVALEFAQHAVQLSHYTLRNTDAPEAKNLALRWWKLEGSKDGKQWVTLDDRSHDSSLANKSQPATFTVPASSTASQYYPFFRLTQTGANAGGGHALSLGGMELYGRLRKRVLKGDRGGHPSPVRAGAELQRPQAQGQSHRRTQLQRTAALPARGRRGGGQGTRR